MKEKGMLIITTLIGLFFFLSAIYGCDGGGINPAGSTTTSLDPLVCEYNAKGAGGHAVRWDKSSITVYDPIGIPSLQQSLDDWNQYLNGRRLVLVNNPGADIEFTRNDSLGKCGYANWRWESGYKLSSAKIEIRCNNAQTAKHELGHSIGFFVHTSDGGVMDSPGGSMTITDTVAKTLRKLYELSPGTIVC